MADLMRLFPRVLIICGGFECARHAGGYWPHDVQARIQLVRFEPINQRLAAEIGPDLSAELGIAPALSGGRLRLSAATRTMLQRRLLPLAAHLHAVSLAAAEGASRVMILESDLKPLAANRLPEAQLKALAQTLRTRPWQIFRPTGYHRAFTSSRASQRNGSCTAACACAAVSPALPRACEVKAAATVHSSPVRSVPRTSWDAAALPLASGDSAALRAARAARAAASSPPQGSCSTPDYSAADTAISASTDPGSGSGYCEVNDNDMYGVHRDMYPVFARHRACLLADLRDLGNVATRLSSLELERRFASLEQTTLQFVDRW